MKFFLLFTYAINMMMGVAALVSCDFKFAALCFLFVALGHIAIKRIDKKGVASDRS